MNVVITVITDKGFENIGIAKAMIPDLNKKLEEGPTMIHLATESILCYGYIMHAKGAKNMLVFVSNAGSEETE